MKRQLLISLCFLSLSYTLFSQDSIQDVRDGEWYDIVTIGNQTWMAENLRAKVYPDGSPLTSGYNSGDIGYNTNEPYYFFYDEDSAYNEDSVNVASYGLMYTWPAAVDGFDSSSTIPSNIQGICPNGWHLPSEMEWRELETTLGASTAGYQMRDIGGSGFNALLSGAHWPNLDTSWNRGTYEYYWATDWNDNGNPSSIYLSIYSSDIYFGSSSKTMGYSVRCLKDYDKPYTIDSVYHITCSDCANGGIDITMLGQPGDTYTWSTGLKAADLMGLNTPGHYNLTVVDESGYTFIDKFYIKQTDTIIDSRDGQEYDIVKVGNTWWMAENLNYDEGANSWCYDDLGSCDSLGKLYHSGALGTACPANWYVPAHDEWVDLLVYMGMEWNDAIMSNFYELDNNIGKRLKLGEEIGFNSLLSGYRKDGGSFFGLNDTAYYWQSSSYTMYKFITQDAGIGAFFDIGFTNDAFSIRCVRNPIEYTIDTILPVTCYGCSDGEIEITASGGSGNISIIWKEGTTGNIISNISSPGYYSFILTDDQNYWISDSVYVKQIDTIVDIRDNQKYETVKVGEQWWMAENMNYKLDCDSCWCFDNIPASCDTFGALYSWHEVMMGDNPTTQSPSMVQGICPDGWMIPSDEDWWELESFIGFPQSDKFATLYRGSTIAIKLRENQALGFNGIYSGYRNGGAFGGINASVSFWTTTEFDQNNAIRRSLSDFNQDVLVNRRERNKNNGYSLRCIRNEADAKIPVAKITLDGEPILCHGDSVTLYGTAGDHYLYQWYKDGTIIPDATSFYYTVKDSGSYSVRVISGRYGGKSYSNDTLIVVHNTNYNADFSALPTNLTSEPFEAEFINSTPSPTSYTYSWQFGDNSTSTKYSPSHTYNYNGTYDVFLKVKSIVTGCEIVVYKPDLITCSGGDNCDMTGNVNVTGNTTFCPGDSVVLTAADNNADSYSWTFNDELLIDADTSTITVKAGGVYNLIVENANCVAFSDAINLTLYPQIKPEITAESFVDGCSIDSVRLSTTASYECYIWSNGDTTASIYADPNDNIWVTILDRFDCNRTSLIFEVNKSIVDPPVICMVTVEVATTHNLVVWEKPWSDGRIESYSVLKLEGASYVEIGNLPFGDLTVFEDVNSDPRVKAENYKISLIDTCGNESARSSYHQTMNLGKSAFGGQVSLFWNRYIDENGVFIPDYYYIYRGVDTASMVKYDSISGYLALGNPIYNILDPVDDEFYYVAVEKGNICNPANLKANNGPFSRSLSNLEDNRQQGTEGINELYSNGKLQIFPNPMNNSTIVKFSNPDKVSYTLHVINMAGETVFVKDDITTDSYELYRGNLESGLYLIKLNGKQVYTDKLMIE